MRQPGASANERRKVLVLGDDARSFLAVVRSLGRRGVEVHAAPIILGTPALTSRYIKAIHYLPFYEGSGRRWLKATEQLLDSERFDVIVPLDDRSIIPFHLHRNLFEKQRVAMPGARAFEVMFSKDNTRELAKSLEIPVARGRLSHSRDTAQSIIAEYDLPVVLKPLSSFSSSKLYEKSVVRRADNQEQLEQFLGGEFKNRTFIIEAVHSGVGVGVSLLAKDGNILQAFEHHRVHEPPGGGGSSYRVSAPLQFELLEACGRFVAELSYTGVAMFEFRQNIETGQWILLEVNGRFWGSLPLAIAAGVDFPILFFDLLVHNAVYSQPLYRYGIYSRSIGDDYWYYRHRFNEFRFNRLGMLDFIQESIGEITHVFKGVERIDTLARDDLVPLISEVRNLTFNPIRGQWRKVFKRLRPFHITYKARLFRNLKDMEKSPPTQIMFVCKGNICRSAFAERVAQKLWPGLRISSAGILHQSGRSSPEKAVKVAGELGIDLRDHRSTILSETDLIKSDIVFVFDFENLVELKKNHPAIRAKVFLLGAYDGGKNGNSYEIADPFGGSIEVFRSCFFRIQNIIGLLSSTVRVPVEITNNMPTLADGENQREGAATN